MAIMTADLFHPLPDDPRGSRPRRRDSPTGSPYDLRNAGIIFGGIALSLAGIFGILEYSTRRVDSDVRAVTALLEVQHKAITGLDRRIDKLDERFAKVDERFEKVDERFAKVDERFDKLEAKFDERFERLETKFDERSVRLETKFDREFERLETHFDRMNGLLLQLVGQNASPLSDPAGTKAGRSR